MTSDVTKIRTAWQPEPQISIPPPTLRPPFLSVAPLVRAVMARAGGVFLRLVELVSDRVLLEVRYVRIKVSPVRRRGRPHIRQ